MLGSFDTPRKLGGVRAVAHLFAMLSGVLPTTCDILCITSPLLLKMPPPLTPAVLRVTMLPRSLRMAISPALLAPEFIRPPPYWVALFSEKELLRIVRLPMLNTPPPNPPRGGLISGSEQTSRGIRAEGRVADEGPHARGTEEEPTTERTEGQSAQVLPVTALCCVIDTPRTFQRPPPSSDEVFLATVL